MRLFRHICQLATMLLLPLLLSGARDAYPDAGHAEAMSESYVLDETPLGWEYTLPLLREKIDTTTNVIYDENGGLHGFLHKLQRVRSGGGETVSIVHIGDSHIQAGFLTERIRALFQGAFGDSGRGFITPFRMARMNEPKSYAITTPYGTRRQKATDAKLHTDGGVSGVGYTFETPYNETTIWSRSKFNSVTVFHHERAPMLREPNSLRLETYCTADYTRTSSKINLQRVVDTLMLYGVVTEEFDNPTYYGFSLENGSPGVLYHEIGLNSAAFEHFESKTTLLERGLAPLNPDLIIISLGTNNSFGKDYRPELLMPVVDRFCGELAASYPGTAVLLTTPMEACVKKVTRGRVSYVANGNVKATGEVVKATAAKHGLAYWDLYAAAGGKGAMEVWYKNGLASADRVHFTESGYAMQAEMLYEAFANYYNRLINPNIQSE